MEIKFVPLSINSAASPAEKRQLVRLNCLGSLYYFIKVGLRRRRLTDHLHLPICNSLERSFIKDVYELPRDHFKSTICSEGLPMWWALPFTNQDADAFQQLGYSDEFIRWMRKIHDTNGRFLLVSENITNAATLGKRIRYHYESNYLYRGLFPETLPDSSCVWTNQSLHIRRPKGSAGAAHGEGTFDFLGVGGALQSRHYHKAIQDDLIGRKALESATEMEKTINYHQLLIGAFETEDRLHDNSELVVGNRWSFHDLNSHIREEEPWFRLVNHSALGGCCPVHPPDKAIFPEEFSEEKLLRWKRRLGSYMFSCQFLNNPVAPEDADFKESWLSYYSYRTDATGDTYIVHEVKNGLVRKDLKINHLSLAMTVDPNHAGNAASGRCRHAITVVGLSQDNLYYLLDSWAMHASYDTFIAKVYEIAKKWRLQKFGVEAIAGQQYLAYHLRYRNQIEGNTVRIVDLKGEVDAPDGTPTRRKEWRIRSLSPIFEQERFFIQRRHQSFLEEYTTFPKGKYVDLLDALAYIPQMMKSPMSYTQHIAMLKTNRMRMRQVNAGYQ